MKIIKKIEAEDKVGDFINEAFTDYAVTNNVALNFEEYWFVAEDDSGEIIGTITGRAYYNEVHIGDLIIDKRFRRQNIGTKLVRAVEEDYKNKGFDKITLTTFGFQAPDFYKKLGYSLEFVREDKDPKLSKYFYCKALKDGKNGKIWTELYEKAKAVQNPREISERIYAGGVAAAIESTNGKIYTGVCIDTSSTLGICAERNAMFNMITNGDNEIRRVLAIMPDGRTGAPCGVCREFMAQLMQGKYEAVEIMLDYENEKIVTLAELTPHWWLE